MVMDLDVLVVPMFPFLSWPSVCPFTIRCSLFPPLSTLSLSVSFIPWPVMAILISSMVAWFVPLSWIAWSFVIIYVKDPAIRILMMLVRIRIINDKIMSVLLYFLRFYGFKMKQAHRIMEHHSMAGKFTCHTWLTRLLDYK